MLTSDLLATLWTTHDWNAIFGDLATFACWQFSDPSEIGFERNQLAFETASRTGVGGRNINHLVNVSRCRTLPMLEGI